MTLTIIGAMPLLKAFAGRINLTNCFPSAARRLQREEEFVARRPNGSAACAAVSLVFLLSACDLLGIQTPEQIAAIRDAEGKAVGGACRHAGRAIEDCYALNRRADKAAVFAGWREMNDYMRENNLSEVPPTLPKPGASGKDAEESSSERSSDSAKSEAGKGDSSKPDSSKTDSGKAEAGKADTGKADSAKGASRLSGQGKAERALPAKAGSNASEDIRPPKPKLRFEGGDSNKTGGGGPGSPGTSGKGEAQSAAQAASASAPASAPAGAKPEMGAEVKPKGKGGG